MKYPESSIERRETSDERQNYSTLVENSLQIDPFMQNKPNLRKAKINASAYVTKDYEMKSLSDSKKTKPILSALGGFKPNL